MLGEVKETRERTRRRKKKPTGKQAPTPTRLKSVQLASLFTSARGGSDREGGREREGRGAGRGRSVDGRRVAVCGVGPLCGGWRGR